jgi:hypothetical protein
MRRRFVVDDERQFAGQIIPCCLDVCSKEPALETMSALSRFGVDRTHCCWIERRVSLGNLIGDIVGLSISGDHKGRFTREVGKGWELDVPGFGGEVPFDIMCEPTSGTSSTEQTKHESRLHVL